MQTDRPTSHRTCRPALAAVAFAVALLAACGDGHGDPEAAAPEPPAAAMQGTLALVGTADHSYASAAASQGGTVEIFRDANGVVTQARYANGVTGERIRVFYGSDGVPTRIYDEASSSSLVITRVSTERVDFDLVDASGNFVAGYALLASGSGYSVAPILGAPALNGQLAGQIAGAAQTASFAVLPVADAGLGAAQAMSAQADQLAQALAQTAPALAAAQMHAMSAHDKAVAALGIDQRAVLAGLAAGLFVGVGAPAGSGLAAALIAGSMLAYGLQNYLLPVVDGVRGVDSLDSLPAALKPLFDRYSTGTSALDAVQAALSGASTTLTLGQIATRAFDAARDVRGALLDLANLPTTSFILAPTTTALSGFGVDQSGATYDYSGSITPAGAVTLTGTSGTNQIQLAGNLTGTAFAGTATGSAGNGSVSAVTTVLGVCATLQQSGGQGTFSYAFDAVATSGTVSFYRQAYSIKDEFRVISSGQTLYTTNGLVSGDETVTLTLNGSRTVFVNVNAPNSGTAWDFQLGCPGS